MKTYVPVLVLGLMGIATTSAWAQNTKTKVQVKIPEKVRTLNEGPSIMKKVGEIIRFEIWAEGLPKPKFNNGMQDSSPYKPFGTLRLDGETYWNYPKPPREYAASWVAGGDLVHRLGQRIKISEDTAHTNGRKFEIGVGYDQIKQFKLSLQLRHLMVDGSAGNNAPPERVKELNEQNNRNYANPPIMGQFDITLDLSRKGAFSWVWSNGDRLGSRLHVKTQRVGYMYKSNVQEIGPVIKKPDIPGRIPGPGPVSKVTKPKVIKQKTQIR